MDNGIVAESDVRLESDEEYERLGAQLQASMQNIEKCESEVKCQMQLAQQLQDQFHHCCEIIGLGAPLPWLVELSQRPLTDDFSTQLPINPDAIQHLANARKSLMSSLSLACGMAAITEADGTGASIDF